MLKFQKTLAQFKKSSYLCNILLNNYSLIIKSLFIMKTLILSIALFFIASFSFAQTPTGKSISINGTTKEVLMGARGGMYYLNENGGKSYLNASQKEKLGLTGATSTTKVSVPTESQKVAQKAKESVLQIFDTYVMYHGVRFEIQEGSRGGRYFEFVNDKGELKKHYLPRK